MRQDRLLLRTRHSADASAVLKRALTMLSATYIRAYACIPDRMTETEKLLYTARVRTVGGRDGSSCSDDRRLDVMFSTPGSQRTGTNPEQMFAAGWSACLLGALRLAAAKRSITLPQDTAINAEVDLFAAHREYFLRARLTVQLPGMDHATAEELVKEGHQKCPYSKATRGNIGVSLNVDGGN